MPRPGEAAQGAGNVHLGHERLARQVVGDLAEEARPALRQQVDNPAFEVPAHLIGDRHEERRQVGGRQADPAVVARQGAGTPPGDLTAREELIEHRRRVVAHARGEDGCLELTGGQGAARQRFDGGVHRIYAGGRIDEALPCREEVGERVGGEWLHLLAQGGDAAPADTAEYVAVAPLGARRARSVAARDDAAIHLKATQGLLGDRDAEAECVSEVGRGERTVGAREACRKISERVGCDLEEGVGDARWECDTERVTQAACVLDRGKVLPPGHADGDRTP